MSDDKNRDVARAYYVRTHAPALLCAIISNSSEPADANDWEWARGKAIEQAGLLFDETETE